MKKYDYNSDKKNSHIENGGGMVITDYHLFMAFVAVIFLVLTKQVTQ